MAKKTALELIKEKANQQSKQNINQSTYDESILNIDEIELNPFQARKIFDEDKLKELSESIIQHGLLQPITVAYNNGKYVLIAGERRLRAHKLANLNKIKTTILQNVTNEQLKELSLVENIQRDDLKLMEEIAIYKELNDNGMSLRKIGELVNKSKSHIDNYLKISKFSKECFDYICDNELTNTKILLTILSCNEKSHIKLLERLSNNKLSLAQAEQYRTNETKEKINKEKIISPYPFNLPEINGVGIKQNKKKIDISINLEDFDNADTKTIQLHINKILEKINKEK